MPKRKVRFELHNSFAFIIVKMASLTILSLIIKFNHENFLIDKLFAFAKYISIKFDNGTNLKLYMAKQSDQFEWYAKMIS
jgi:helix-turn-helix protein